MATQVDIKFNSEGFKQILMSGGTESAVRAATEKIAARANANGNTNGFVSKVWVGNYGGGRWVGSVMTGNHEAVIAEAEEKALTGAVR